MIALVIATAVTRAAIMLPFAPPIGQALHYMFDDRRPDEDGDTDTRMDYAMSFDRGADGGLVATQVETGFTVDAPPAALPRLEALYRPFVGVPLRVALDRAGQPGDVIDGARTWAGIRASYRAMAATVAAQTDLDPEEKRAALARIARLEPPPAAPDEPLRDTAAVLLPPPLPALRPSERRALTTSIAGPAGLLPATGSVTLEQADAARLVYHILIASDAGAGDAAAAALRAATPADASPGAKARAEALAAALAGARIEQDLEIEIERATGLLLRSHGRRSMRRGDEPPRLVAERTIALQR